jgi:uncharacterized protein involved in type VI secretion and phage assembly
MMTTRPQQPGVVVGVVKSLEDPDSLGRLKLEFPWLGRIKSAWASVAVPLAGKDRGAWFMPEKDDEVLVAFEHGHFAHPYVVGFLWNGVDKPPTTDPKHRVIKTPGDHELRFEDTDGAKKIIVKSAAGFRVELDDAGKKLTLSTPGKLSVTLDDNGPAIEVKGGGRAIALRDGKVQIT